MASAAQTNSQKTTVGLCVVLLCLALLLQTCHAVPERFLRDDAQEQPAAPMYVERRLANFRGEPVRFGKRAVREPIRFGKRHLFAPFGRQQLLQEQYGQ